MQRYLLFDSGCSVCSGLARDVEAHSEGRLSAQSLADPKIQQLLGQAKPDWRWEPTLMEVNEATVKAFTGVSMRTRLLYALGPRRSWRVAQLVAQTSGSTESGGTTRKDFFKQAGAALTGVTGLAVFGAAPASAGEKARTNSMENWPGHYARREGVKSYSNVENADTAMQVQFTHAQPTRSGTLVSQGLSDPQTSSFQLVRNGDTVVKVTLDKANGSYDIEDNAGRSTHFVFTEEGVSPESAAVVETNRDDITLAAAIQGDLEMLMAPAISDPEASNQGQAQGCLCDPNVTVRGVGRGASRTGACKNATSDANLKCSNCSCLGCCSLYRRCDCVCGVGDYICQCGRSGQPCYNNCLPSCR